MKSSGTYSQTATGDFGLKPAVVTSTELSSSQQEKITNLCNLYGLNEQETKQLIEQLKAGSNLSIDNQSGRNSGSISAQDRRQSSIVSYKNQQLSFNDSDYRFDEEYSFKQNAQPVPNNAQEGQLERMLMARLKHEDDYVDRLREENEQLKRDRQEMSMKISAFLKMKEQETEIMLGLKNTICSLTNLLSQKENAYNQLLENYTRLSEKKFEQNAQFARVKEREAVREVMRQPVRQSTKQPVRQPLREHLQTQQRDSTPPLDRRQSKQFTKNRSTTNFHQKQESSKTGKQNQPVQPSLKKTGATKSKIDISKYKVFIDELRSICINKQK